MINNKIKIPWYRRTPKGINVNDMGENPISFHIPDIPKPTPRPRTEPVREPVKSPVTEPVKSPVTSPIFQPDFKPFPFPNPLPFPNHIPLPERKPNNPAPQGNPAPAPQIPAFPMLWNSPMFTDPNYDWAKHFEEVAKNLPQPKQPAPEPENKNAFQKSFETIMKPVVWLFFANEVKNQYIKVNVTDPIYNRMLEDAVLGPVLREGEKANMDAEKLGTILANFDWENGDYKDLEKSLAAVIGVAGAARLMVFIIGRKVLFRI